MSPAPLAVTAQRIAPWLRREMARDADVLRRRLPAALDEDPHPSEILETRSEPGDRLGELYDRMLRTDLSLRALADKRTDAVCALERRIVPGDTSPRAEEAAALGRWTLDQIPELDANVRHQIETSYTHGIAIDEVIWDRVRDGGGPFAGAVVPVDLIDRPMARFTFRKGRLYVRRPLGTPRRAPAGKFVVRRQRSKDSPWGKAALDDVYWLWFIGLHGWTYFAEYLETYASPAVLARYRRTKDENANQDEQDAALELARSVRGGRAAAVAEGLVVELLEAKRSGHAAYREFLDKIDRAKALLFLGEVSTSGMRPGVGAFASDSIADEIRTEKVCLDGAGFAAHVSRTLLRWVTRVNFGPDVAPPRMVCEVEDVVDVQVRRAALRSALDLGLAVPLRQVRKAFGVDEPRPGEAVVSLADGTSGVAHAA